MADRQISELVEATAIEDNDLLVLQQGETAKKAKGKTVKDWVYNESVENFVIVSDTEPTTERNHIWVDPSEEDVVIPTMDDLQGLTAEDISYDGSATHTSGSVGEAISELSSDIDGLDAGDVEYDSSTTYGSGTVGSALATQSEKIDEMVIISETQPSSENNKIWIDSNAESVQVPVMEDVYKILPVVTISDQDIATFANGADSVPVKSLVININPVQSGSGDPAPDNVREITGHTGANLYEEDEYDASATAKISVSFPASAGTVYGGTLDVVKKKLTVNKKSIIFNGNVSESWADDPSGGFYRFRITIADSDAKWDISSVLCNIGKFASASNVEYSAFKYSNMYYYIPNQEIATVSAFKTWLSTHNLQFVYPLKTPVEYDLSSVNNLETLFGANAIWADTGNVNELKYRADVKLYIDGAVSS